HEDRAWQNRRTESSLLSYPSAVLVKPDKQDTLCRQNRVSKGLKQRSGLFGTGFVMTNSCIQFGCTLKGERHATFDAVSRDDRWFRRSAADQWLRHHRAHQVRRGERRRDDREEGNQDDGKS